MDSPTTGAEMTRPNKSRVRKAGKDCWAVTNDYFCEELNQMMYTTRLLRTWREAMQHAQKEQR